MDLDAVALGLDQQLLAQDDAAHHAQAPVDEAQSAGDDTAQDDDLRAVAGQTCESCQDALGRRRGGDRSAGRQQHDHLHRELEQVPERSGPGAHQRDRLRVAGPDGGVREDGRQHRDQQCEGQADDERVGHPADEPGEVAVDEPLLLRSGGGGGHGVSRSRVEHEWCDAIPRKHGLHPHRPQVTTAGTAVSPLTRADMCSTIKE